MIKGVFLYGNGIMKEDKLLEKVEKNSGAIELIVRTALAMVVVIVSVTLFFGDIRGLPDEVKDVKARVAALELNYATYVTKIDTSMTKLVTDVDAIKMQFIKQGMAHEEKITRVIHEYPHKEKELELEYGKIK